MNELLARFPSCDQSKVTREYARYIFDKNVDDVFHHCDGNNVKLWNTLSNEGYPELSRIALGILVIAPENASCERAFSIMNYEVYKKQSMFLSFTIAFRQCPTHWSRSS